MTSAAKIAAWTALAVAVAVAAEGEEDRDGRSGSTMLVDIARELIARSGTSSQVLSLNLTNLVILLVLKGLLVGAAMWGAKGPPGGDGGLGGGWQRGRAAQHPAPPSASFFSEPELALLVTYLMGESVGGPRGDTCLLMVACEEPKKAREYIAAGRMTLKAAKILDKVVPVNPKYPRLLDDVTAAAKLGADDGAVVCRQTYPCGQNSADDNRL